MADLHAVATQMAQKYGVPVNVFLAQIGQESGFNPNARSGAGALGIAQFMPATAKSYGVNPLDPNSSLDGAARYDRDLLKKYGSVQAMLSAYNSGRPDAYKDPHFAGGQTFNYVKSILGKSGGVNPTPTGGSPVSQGSPSFQGGFDPSAMSRNLVANFLLTAARNGGQTTGGGLMDLIQQRSALNASQGSPGFNLNQSLEGPQGPGQSLAGPLPANQITQVTSQFLGVPYVWGGNDAKKGLDCSSFVQQAYARLGVNLPRTTYAQFKVGQPVPLQQLQAGDLVFTHQERSGPGHVGIYIGNGQVQESPHTGDVNKVIPLHSFLGGGFVGARRVTGGH